ncbi:hypothetical protein UlMin_017426 [Ulmus minor]
MIVLAWNCRGMGQPSAIRELRALVRSSNPDCIMLMEAKVNSGTMVSILHNLHFLNHVYVPPVGLSGGFCVAWRDGIDMEPVTMNKHIMSFLVFSSPGSAPWLLSAVYGPNSSVEKRLFWDNIHLQTNCFLGAWLIIGDFNTIWSSSDRSSGSGMDIGSRRMRTALNNLGMLLIPASGVNYSWSNRRQGNRRIRSKIDRAVANEEWWRSFPNASIRMLPQTTSDHNPQILYCFGQNSFAKRPFRFEAMWTEDKRSYWVVNQAWNSMSHQFPPSRFYKRLSACRHALWHWNKSQFARDSNLRSHLEYLLKLEEMFWLQKSRLKWQTDGDRCTRFFFLSTLARRKNNRIECIKDDSGIWLSSREDIGNIFLAKLRATYDEDQSPNNIDLSHLISPSISVEDNQRLIAIPDWDEIRNTVFRMGSFKAAGPDDDVVAIVRNFFLTSFLRPYLNQSNIILVPKGQNSVQTAFGFHPKWICWVLLCCSTTSMTLMLNGAAFQSFRPNRGLRQGDPISPYLFILCMEVLSRLINQKVSAGHIAGFKLDHHTPALHHLFFADDIFLMGKCTVNEAFYFKDCLDTFCSCPDSPSTLESLTFSSALRLVGSLQA